MKAKLNVQNIRDISEKQRNVNKFKELKKVALYVKKAAKEGKTGMSLDIDWCDKQELLSLFEKRGFDTEEHRRHININWR